MRSQGWGKIVNIGSMGGRLTFPGGGIYHATKYAVEALSDAMRFELRGFGVDVILVEPGLIVTNFGEVAAGSVSETDGGGAYGEFNREVAKVTAAAYEGPMAKLGAGPEAVAKTIARALERAAAEGALPGHGERADHDRPAPDHPGPGVGSDDALAVPAAEVALRTPGCRARPAARSRPRDSGRSSHASP